MKRYLVGGAVRDLLLGRPVVDQDYLIVDATPEAFLKRYRRARRVGKTFPVFMLGLAQYAWPRGETLADDLLARDLTINAMAMGDSHQIAGRLQFHPLALSDLKNRILRPCGEMSMFDDPLRVYRAARFAAVLPDFTPHEELLVQMRAVAKSGSCPMFRRTSGPGGAKALDAAKPSRVFSACWPKRTAFCLGYRKSRPAWACRPAPSHTTWAASFDHLCDMADALAGQPLAGWMGVCHGPWQGR